MECDGDAEGVRGKRRYAMISPGGAWEAQGVNAFIVSLFCVCFAFVLFCFV